MEKQIREALIAELERQAAAKPQQLEVKSQGEVLSIKGEVNVDELVMAVAGSLAGGP